MGEINGERDGVLRALAAALLGLVGQEVTASVLAPDGKSTLVYLYGQLEQAFELPWRWGEVLVVRVCGGSVLIRVEEVDEVDRWSFQVAGESYGSVCVHMRDGTSVLIQKEVEQGSPT